MGSGLGFGQDLGEVALGVAVLPDPDLDGVVDDVEVGHQPPARRGEPRAFPEIL